MAEMTSAQRDAYWSKTSRLMWIIMVLWVVFSFIIPAFAVQLNQIKVFGFPLGFFQSGIIAGMGATFAELFPTRVRGTGQGFSYNTGRAVGSLVPALVGVLAAGLGLGTAMGLCAAGAYVFVLIAAAMLPETRGRELETTVEPQAGTSIPRYVAPPVPTFGGK